MEASGEVSMALAASRGFASEDWRVRFGSGEVGREGGGWIGLEDIDLWKLGNHGR